MTTQEMREVLADARRARARCLRLDPVARHGVHSWDALIQWLETAILERGDWQAWNTRQKG